jgi:hypothetical protein
MSVHWEKLYAMQDWALGAMAQVEHGLYLTGGTALSRGYCRHRHSEDLDFFTSDRGEFETWRDSCLAELDARCGPERRWSLEVMRRQPRFGRAIVHGELDLKLEFVNDVPFRMGEPVRHPTLGLLDTRENILANKITALVDRAAPKDIADIFWLCCREGLSLEAALDGADGKAAGIFPPLVARRLEEAAKKGLPDVYWITSPSEQEFAEGMEWLVGSLLGLECERHEAA